MRPGVKGQSPGWRPARRAVRRPGVVPCPCNTCGRLTARRRICWCVACVCLLVIDRSDFYHNGERPQQKTREFTQRLLSSLKLTEAAPARPAQSFGFSIVETARTPTADRSISGLRQGTMCRRGPERRATPFCHRVSVWRGCCCLLGCACLVPKSSWMRCIGGGVALPQHPASHSSEGRLFQARWSPIQPVGPGRPGATSRAAVPTGPDGLDRRLAREPSPSQVAK